MLPTRINVLPPEKKVHLHRMIRGEFIRNSLALLIVVCAIVAIASVASRAVLQTYFFDLAKSLNAVTIQSTDKNARIVQANNRITIASRVVSRQYYWPALLADINNTIPDAVIISKITIDRNERVATLVGTSLTRDALVQLGERLRELSVVSTVDIPISQLTQQEDISFTIRMTLSL